MLVNFRVEYAGENFVRFSGDTTKHAQAQLFAWEAYERGVDVHLLAEPTKLEQLKKEYETHKDRFKKKTQNTVIAKYGGEEHLQTPPVQLLLAQTEEYVEYSRRGDIIKVRIYSFKFIILLKLFLMFIRTYFFIFYCRAKKKEL